VALNPTLDLGLPTAGTRDRAATPQQAAELLAAFSDSTALERAIWATAFYAGLRRGEERALRVRNVDLEAATIDVEHGWDAKEGQVDTKSRAGVRRVFLLDVVRPYVEPLVKRRSDDELVFGHGKAPFEPRAVARRAERAWAAYSVGAFIRGEPSVFEPFTLHEARHSFSTWMDHAGISEARCDRYMGHARSGVAGRYRHLLPAQIAEDAAKLDAYLTGARVGKGPSARGRAIGFSSHAISSVARSVARRQRPQMVADKPFAAIRHPHAWRVPGAPAKSPDFRGFIGAPRFELGTSSPVRRSPRERLC
jgi:site-specific recombinase XerC